MCVHHVSKEFAAGVGASETEWAAFHAWLPNLHLESRYSLLFYFACWSEEASLCFNTAQWTQATTQSLQVYKSCRETLPEPGAPP